MSLAVINNTMNQPSISHMRMEKSEADMIPTHEDVTPSQMLDADSPTSLPSPTTENPRKRKRPRKDPDQRHICHHPGCGKAYSRAEHLCRHQLNHKPKEIFHCKYTNCARTFVRQDLCIRHEERHSLRGTLDVIPGKPAGAFRGNSITAHSLTDIIEPRADVDVSDTKSEHLKSSSSAAAHCESALSMSPTNNAHSNGHRQESISKASPTEVAKMTGSTGFIHPKRVDSVVKPSQGSQAYVNDVPPATGQATHENSMRPPLLQTISWDANGGRSPAWSDASTRPPEISNQAPAMPISTSHMDFDNNMSAPIEPMHLHNSAADIELDRWFFPDDTTAWLFGMEQALDQSHYQYEQGGIFNTFSGVTLSDAAELSPSFFGDGTKATPPQQPALSPHPMSLSAIMDFEQTQPDINLSEETRRALLAMIEARWDKSDECPGIRSRVELLGGDQTQHSHPFSLEMLQTYLASYWSHFHPQMPLIHKPTFDPNAAPELLVIALIILGASTLDRIHGYEVTQTCAELAAFLAWHLRWSLFKHQDFRPPAKLWIFQSLILLEYYEKMYATKRVMHERAHIHHGTTLTLMRRGSFMVGKSSSDIEPLASDTGMYGRTRKPLTAAEQWWHDWASKEAIRRAVFSAFVMDTMHAVMFGHAAVLAVHEMRVPLPCCEGLWNNPTASEVARAEANVKVRDERRPMFLDSLKKTLNGHPVATNVFGRNILVAGLLSVSWHMSQRDLQISSLGVAPAMGNEEKWKTSLKRAFAFWKRDFDDYIENTTGLAHCGDETNIFELRTVMYHFAHVALYSDIVDIQIFSGSPAQVGRRVNPQDRQAAERRVREIWAPSHRAQEATYHALQFLRRMLTPSDSDDNYGESLRSVNKFDYSAREDDLLNRPWILFYCALLVWCYAYALEGPLTSLTYNVNRVNKIQDMRLYLRRLGGVSGPEDLKHAQKKNHCIGLLMTLRDLFMDTRWHLLHEASRVLENCIDMLLGKERIEMPVGLPPGH